MTLLIVIIALALIFDYINGFHDAANSIATVVSTKVLTPFQAVLWAALFNTVAFWIFKDHAVANSISKTVYKEFITLPVIFSGLLAAIFWNLLTWWYGIPSSSSHTLIGGFAGAAIAHALSIKGINFSWAKIVDADTIIKTILFIFLAPLIGIITSMFITVVTIMRNIWFRIGIIILTTLLTAFLFDYFENSKMNENTQKFYGIDKYKKELSTIQSELAVNSADTALLKKLNLTEEKLTKATASFNSIHPLIENFDNTSANYIAKVAKDSGWLDQIAVSKLKDAVRNANDFLVLEAKAPENDSAKKEYDIAKVITEEYKAPVKLFLAGTISVDSTVLLINQIYPIQAKNMDKVKAKLTNFNIEKTFAEEIDKADNTMIVNGIFGTALIFILIYLYVEKIKTPTALTVGNMFKKLQLFSSAAFSIGHGGNDAQKVMGIIGAALIASGSIQDFASLPSWVPVACYLAIGLGTMSGGWKIVKTMGSKITKVTPLEGVAAETAGAFTLFFTGQMGIPVSTTHTITGSIIGVGATKRLSAVRWGVTTNLLWAWILTIPVSAVLAAITYFIVKYFLG
ncbi:MAG: inorganic phosphate transporter [Chitinophagaceae bacterium]|jgi:PiT family inorganic phosphate transporter|nr:inorganic phosphate transporter [Chitinophagaceae bacterium]MCF8288892.1 inorganic phosphate transporter [Chitinophagaceae bacterium]MCF8421668.1 inorganic phosphate transporter [Chitinophagaceae bacterium]